MSVESTLTTCAVKNELHHALILHGANAQALRDLAISVAKALNCLNHTTGDDCSSCNRIGRRVHPDIHQLEVGGERKLISVEQVRELIESASMRPYEGRQKVYIIDPADALSVPASNALLKTLEEPVRDTTFFLLTRSPELLLPTVRSRSQSLHVGGTAAADDELMQLIERALRRFAENKEGAALLELAAIVADREDVDRSMAALIEALCRSAAYETVSIERGKLLAAADKLMNSLRWLTVNADSRMLVELALAELAR